MHIGAYQVVISAFISMVCHTLSRHHISLCHVAYRISYSVSAGYFSSSRIIACRRCAAICLALSPALHMVTSPRRQPPCHHYYASGYYATPCWLRYHHGGDHAKSRHHAIAMRAPHTPSSLPASASHAITHAGLVFIMHACRYGIYTSNTRWRHATPRIRRSRRCYQVGLLFRSPAATPSRATGFHTRHAFKWSLCRAPSLAAADYHAAISHLRCMPYVTDSQVVCHGMPVVRQHALLPRHHIAFNSPLIYRHGCHCRHAEVRH